MTDRYTIKNLEIFNNNFMVIIKQLQFINKINVGSDSVISWKAREVFMISI